MRSMRLGRLAIVTLSLIVIGFGVDIWDRAPDARAPGASTAAIPAEEPTAVTAEHELLELEPSPEPRSLISTESVPARAKAAPAPAPAQQPSRSAITGIVLARDGAPARRARVTFFCDDRGRLREIAGTTNRKGEFELEVGTPGVHGELMASGGIEESSPIVEAAASGAHDVELRLGPPSPVSLEIRDHRGRPVEDASLELWLQLAGHRVPLETTGSSPWLVARPPASFFASVSGRGLEDEEFGPFDPMDVDETLVLHVASLPRLRGIVRCGGVPVENVRVEMRYDGPSGPESPRPFWRLGGRTDREGRFDAPYRDAGFYLLRAFDSSCGDGTTGTIATDGVNDVEAIELVLDRPTGSIAGRVILPAGRRPEELCLETPGARGYRTLREDGSYVIPGLKPGPYRVHVRATVEGAGADQWVRKTSALHTPEWLAFDMPPHVEVRAAETSRLDIDLTLEAPVRLDGCLRIDGKGPPPPERLDRLEAMLSNDQLVSLGAVKPDGAFALGAFGPGEYTLSLQVYPVPPRLDFVWLLQDNVTLTAGRNSWSVDIATGAIRVSPDAAHPLWDARLWARWTGQGELRARIPSALVDDETGSLFFSSVPVGTVQIVDFDEDGGETVLDCVVRPGETTEVRWP